MKRGPAQRMTRTVDIAPVLHDLAVQLARTRRVAEPFLDLRVEKIHPDHAKCIVTCDEMRALEQLRRALLSAGHLEPRERLVAECAELRVHIAALRRELRDLWCGLEVQCVRAASDRGELAPRCRRGSEANLLGRECRLARRVPALRRAILVIA